MYLGSVVSKNGGTEEDVASRIEKANGLFVKLNPLWRNHNISKSVKIDHSVQMSSQYYYMLVKPGKLLIK